MRNVWDSFIKFFTSLHLTVVLLALSIILIFVATLDQVNLGIWAVQEKYFRTFIVLWTYKGLPIPVFPGGYFLGTLLLVNLVASHVYRFKFSWKKAGIFLTHAGLIVLLVGELMTGIWQEEYQLRLDQGQTRNYSESYRDNELAIVDVTDPEWDQVVVIPETKLKPQSEIQHERLPFRIVTRSYFPNAAVQLRDELGPNTATQPAATRDIGARLAIIPLAMTYKQNERNLPAAVIELLGPSNVSLGTWAVSTMLVQPQTFDYAGRTFRIALRFQRAYKPYSLTLLKFSHDRYIGTEIPKNFASQVRLHSADGTTDREVLIYMNNPLRYDGMTFYQAGFDNNDTTTILQVVRNPSWLIPYLSCLLMTVGLFWQFGWHLFQFVNRRNAVTAAVPDFVIAFGIVLILRMLSVITSICISASSYGVHSSINIGLSIAEFAVCLVLFFGLVKGRKWVPPFLLVYICLSVVLLAVAAIQQYLSTEVYQAILSWVAICLHALIVIGLVSLYFSFRNAATNYFVGKHRSA